MKKRFLVLTVLAIFFVGCSSDSGSGSVSVTESNILGKWYLRGKKYNTDPFEATAFSCSTSKDFNEILSNHHIIFTGYGTDCTVNDSQDSYWTLEGKIFTIIYEDPAIQSDVYQVVKLTDTEMQMKQTSGSDSYIYYLNKL